MFSFYNKKKPVQDDGTQVKALAGYEHTVLRSDRRSFAVEVRADGCIVLRVPRRASRLEIEAFAAGHKDWIVTHVRAAEEKRRGLGQEQERLTEEEMKQLHDAAKLLLPERVRVFAPAVGVDYGRITIRAQRSKWGSCSGTGNLNFNCLLLLMPPEVIDYVVVHELCHRLEMNHSQAFWAQVKRVLPEYEKPKRWLKENGDSYMLRLPL